MSKKKIIDLIEQAIKDGQERPHALKQTNILNAEYAAGKVFGLLDVIKMEYGLEVMADIYSKYRDQIDGFATRTQELY